MSISLYIHLFIDQAYRFHIYLIIRPSLWSTILDHLPIPGTSKSKVSYKLVIKIVKERKRRKILVGQGQPQRIFIADKNVQTLLLML